MALLIDLRINNLVIGHLEAVRIDGSDRPDSINTYRVVLTSGVSEWVGEVVHRYGDGAWELVRKVIEARRDHYDGEDE